MEHLIKQLLAKKEQLQNIMQSIMADSLSTQKGDLRVGYCKGNCQYYVRAEKSQESLSRWTYLHKNDMKIAQKIAQRDYNQKVLKEVEMQLKTVEKAILKLQDRRIEEIYMKEGEARQKLLKAWILPEEEFIRQWSMMTYEGRTFSDTQVEIYTEKGERVRSKSEKIIADKLYKKGIPYHYEYPIILPGIGKIYPDFTCLRLRDRQQMVWEHFGMMTDPAYSKNAMKKMETYGKNGYVPEKNILYTFESAECALNTVYTDKLIEEMLM